VDPGEFPIAVCYRSPGLTDLRIFRLFSPEVSPSGPFEERFLAFFKHWELAYAAFSEPSQNASEQGLVPSLPGP
jgi:hypothetical protein